MTQIDSKKGTPETDESRFGALKESADRVLIVVNPRAGFGFGQAAVAALVACLAARKLKPKIVSELAEISALGAESQPLCTLRAVVAAGGDGTLAEVVNRTPPGLPIAVFPLGTANLMASYFRIEPHPWHFANMIGEGQTVQLDAGTANGRIFLLVAGCGFDADVVHRLHARRRGGNITFATWIRPVCDSVRGYSYPALRVYCRQSPDSHDVAPQWTARWAFIVNLPSYAGNLLMAPQASGTDGLLDVSTFDRGSLWHALRYLACTAAGVPHWSADHRSSRVTGVRIESDEPVPYQLDGDPGGYLPLEIDVLPRRLTLIYSRHYVPKLLQPTAVAMQASDQHE